MGISGKKYHISNILSIRWEISDSIKINKAFISVLTEITEFKGEMWYNGFLYRRVGSYKRRQYLNVPLVGTRYNWDFEYLAKCDNGL